MITHSLPPSTDQLNPPSAPPSKRGHKGLLIGLGCVGALFALVVLLGAVGSGSKPTAAPPSTTAPTAQAPTTTNPRAAVQVWAVDFLPIMGSLKADMAIVSDAGETTNISAMKTGCASMRTHVTQAKRLLPAPDPAVNADLEPAMDDYGRAADYCLSGLATLDADQLQLAITAMDSANRHIKAAGTALGS